jgi:hypothetical protein
MRGAGDWGLGTGDWGALKPAGDGFRSGPSNQADSDVLSEVEGRQSAKRAVRAETGTG